MSELPEYVVRLLDKIAIAEGFSNHTIETAAGSKHGDGFMSLMVSATIVGERNRNGKKSSDKLQLLCKLRPSNAERRKEFLSEEVFAREVLAYNKILPLFAEFQREKGLTNDDSFNAYPKCYAAVADADRDEYVLIMEDLRARGYVMLPKALSLMPDHAYAVIERLAKLHAISFALQDQRPNACNEFNNLEDLFKCFQTQNARALFTSSYERAAMVLENPEHIKIAEDLKNNMERHFDDCIGLGVANPFSALLHGDCWNNNILFQYKDGDVSVHSIKTNIFQNSQYYILQGKELNDVCLVDWQIIRFGSPIVDLVYNIFNSTDKEFRQREYHNLLIHYHKQLAAMIRRLGSDPDILYPWSEFQRQQKTFGKYAFLMCPMLLPMIVADVKDIPDMDEVVAKMVNNEDVELISPNFDEETLRKMSKRINDVFIDLVELGCWN